MLNLYNHRFGTYHGYDIRDGTGIRAIPTPTADQLDDPGFEPLARYWVNERDVNQAVPAFWDRDWFLGWRDITNVTNERTFVASVMPKTAIGHKFPLAFPAAPHRGPLLQAVWSSLIFDYISRQKLSGTGMSYFFVKQMACPVPTKFLDVPKWFDCNLEAFVRARIVELTYTSDRLRAYAEDLVDDNPGSPYRWVPERRDQIRAEIDAAMFHMYEVDRDDTAHVLDSFSALRRHDERDHGEFRTKRLVLAAYDAMAKAAATGVAFRSPLDPPPGQGPRHTRSSS